MQPRPLEPSEPVVLALIDAVTAWQDALDQTLRASGLNYSQWLLLRAIRHGAFRRGIALAGPMPIDVAQSETMLDELRRDGWIEYTGTLAPRIAEGASTRVQRTAQALSALHSVSVAGFNRQERAALASLLDRMQAGLSGHTSRQARAVAETARQERHIQPPPCPGLPPVAHRPATNPSLAARF
ncbi:MarR family transcriptional regulator [Cupriavidus necator]|uniref:MarR family transcriptional regulator n=1 Tax=Cupriavidus necator TaxID=106590 RepID=UPI002782C611|nr:MarR family transcriptional regulator [Cupriavidus necator]MDQ0140067.1 DNA-binding MarR family transcriptional regulator [Cupriavidus necator]